MNGYNFTERVRKVLAMSREEAHRLGHEYVGTEHVLLGLIREGEGVAAAALHCFSIDVQELRDRIESVVKSPGAGRSNSPDLPYTTRAKKVLEFSMSEARELNHSYVGTEHLLLGLIREEKGIAAQILTDMNLTLEGVREEILRLLGTDAPPSRQSFLDSPHSPPRTAGKREWVTDGDSGEMGAFGPQLGPLFRVLRNEVGWLFVKWDQFQTLYGGRGERLDLVNATAPLFFRVVEEALWNDIRSHIRALSAEAEPNRQYTIAAMSVHDVAPLIDDDKLRTEIRMLLSRVSRATEWAREGGMHRRVRGEVAVALERKARPLDGPSRAAVTDALEAIAAVVNYLSWHYQQSTITFDTAGYPHGVVALLYAIQHGRSAQDSRRASGARDDETISGGEGPPAH